jgi:Ca2+-binding RTX toxin-like protein
MFAKGTRRGDRLTGGADRDELVGDWGNDILFGLDGDDLLIGDLNDETSARAGGNDRLVGGGGNDVMIGGRGDDRLIGGAGDDWLVGGFANGTFEEGPSAGHSVSYGYAVPAGDDVYDGGTGVDIGFLLYRGDGAITLDMSNTRNAAVIQRDGADAGSIVNVELLVFQGGDGDDHVVAARNAPAYRSDILDGGAGNDVLDGGGGIDLLTGGAGDDTLIGGGEDIASYEDRGFDGTDMPGVRVDLRLNGQAQDTGGSGTDTLFGIRSLYGSGGSDVLIGNAVANELRDQQGGDDRLDGGAGDDSLRADRFLGTQATSVTLDGNVGNDTIEFWSSRNAAHDVTLLGGIGNDRIAAMGVAHATIDAGTGDDQVTVETSGGHYAVLLGRGVDTLILSEAPAATLSERSVHVTDFATGDSGDKVDLRAWLTSAAIGFVAGDDPFDAYLRLERQGSDVVLLGDRDGAGDAFAFDALAVFEETRLVRFTDANFIIPAAPADALLASDFS